MDVWSNSESRSKVLVSSICALGTPYWRNSIATICSHMNTCAVFARELTFLVKNLSGLRSIEKSVTETSARRNMAWLYHTNPPFFVPHCIINRLL